MLPRMWTESNKEFYIVLYCIVLYCIVLYCIVLYCIVLYCIETCVVLTCLYTSIHMFTRAIQELMTMIPL